MTDSRVFWVLALTAFIASCVCYRWSDEKNGDRLLFLATGLVLGSVVALLRTWEVL